MANIFKQQKDLNNTPNRNNFDLSFQNHLTLKFGKLYPVFCKEVVPGDSFRIKSAFGLKFMPMVFPVQSKMRASMHFYYVRNKNLWNRWEDWIQGLKTEDDGVVHPYISRPAGFFRTGTLLDYMNVPTTIADDANIVSSLSFNRHGYCYNNRGAFDLYPNERQNIPAGVTSLGIYPMPKPVFLGGAQTIEQFALLHDNVNFNYGMFDCVSPDNSSYRNSFAYLSDDAHKLKGHVSLSAQGGSFIDSASNVKFAFALFDTTTGIMKYFVPYTSCTSSLSGGHFKTSCDLNVAFGTYRIALVCVYDQEYASNGEIFNVPCVFDTLNFDKFDSNISDSPVTPFSQDQDVIRISALPFRAYEAIKNVFYRNSVVDPFKINGQIEYNKFITYDGDGADNKTPLELGERNYEFDFLTSAMPSPQQGVAPLVGISALGSVSITDERGNPVNATYEIDTDGTFTGRVSIHNPAASTASKTYLSQAGMALCGLSINDFRNVNALQAWLETNIRKGYRYVDFIEGHFGKAPKYDVLDLPEFIGGFSRDVQVSQIVQSADMGVIDEKAGTLGSFAGMASCFGGSEHDITHYCDDYGFIIGILCVTPTPSYSQLLPKMYLKNNPLDYYFNEFSHLGMQPITYEEVTPLSAHQYNLRHPDNPQPLTDTFGYQRPNYDLVASVDEVHGQFRTSLRDFLISRYFINRPELGRDFIKIKNDDVNSIFSIQSPDDDNILGQIIFQVYAKRPIPRVVIPSLGR